MPAIPRAEVGLSELNAFAAVATHRSFRKAADELGVKASTLSHLLRSMETRVGVRLLHRTTRSVAPTEAGARLLERLRPVLRELGAALAEVDDFRGQPSGTLRINASEAAARWLLDEIVPTYLARHPGMRLDIVTDGTLVDIVAAGFDAGIRLADAVPQDMVAIPVGVPARFVTVASPAYLKTRRRPRTPADLRNHACIRHRFPSGKLFRWDFERHGETVVLDVDGSMTLDHPELMARAAAADLGIAYVPIAVAAPYLATKQLVIVLGEWCPELPGLSLYYPGHRHVPAGLRALVEILRERRQSSK